MGRRVFGRVLKTRSGQYAIRYRVDGMEIQKTIGPKLKDAADALKDIASKRAREEHLGIKPVAAATFEEVWGKVAPILKARITPYGGTVAEGMFTIVGEFFGERTVSAIDSADVEEFLAHIRNIRGAKPSTANRYLSFLSRFFTEAAARGLAKGNPAADVKRAPEESRPVPFLSAEDVRRIEERTPEAFRAFVAVAGETGARRGELIALTWQDVHLARRRLVIRRSKNKRPREIPLTAHALAVLERALAGRGAIPMTGDDMVFPAIDGATLSKRFPQWTEAAGLPRLRFHDLRHGWASRLARAGVPVTFIQKLGGWGSLRMVERYGAHAPANFADTALDALERAEAPRVDAAKPEARKVEPAAPEPLAVSA